jgi:hypothetical protein
MTAPTGIVTRIWRIDLARAQQILALFKAPQKDVKGTNRKWSPVVVKKYAHEMLTGHWGFSHQGFAFTGFIADGTAVGKDGEQRLRALILACTEGIVRDGVTYGPDPRFAFDVMITEGLDEKAWLTMDTGKGRRPGDFLSSEGEVNTNVMSSLISLAMAYENEPAGVPYLKDRWVNSRLTPIMRSEYLAANPGLRESLYEGSRLGKRMTVAAAAAGHFLAIKSGVKSERIGDFMDLLHSGAGMAKDDPALVLREMLLNARNTRRNFTREEQLALFIKAFNKWNAGDKIIQLSFKTKKSVSTRAGKLVESSAEIFPRFKA